MITSPNARATPTCPSACVFESTMTAPARRRRRARTCRSPRRRALAPTTSAAARGRQYRQRLGLRLGASDALHDRAVHAVRHFVGELDADLLEARLGEPGFVLALRQRARDAADVAASLG